MKILLAVDGSSYTKRMLAYLAAHDEWLGAHHEYTLLHANTALPAHVAAAVDKATLQSWHDATADKVFKPLRNFFSKQGLNARYITKTGEPANVIASTASKGGYDLVMLGSHGHGTLVNLLLGSVATKVVAQCKTPVLLVR